MATEDDAGNGDATIEREAVEEFTVAQPDPRGGRTPAGEIRGLRSWTFSVPASVAEQIEQTLRIHNTGTLRSHATFWRGRRELQGQREAPEDRHAAEVVPAPAGDATAVVLRQEVEVLRERLGDLRRDCQALDLRRTSLQTEVDGLVQRKLADLAEIGRLTAAALAQQSTVLSEQDAKLAEHLRHNNLVITEANAHARLQLRGAWDLEGAQAQQRSQVTKEIAQQAEDIGKIRQQLHGSLWTDRLGDFLKEGRLAFRDALNSSIGQGIQFRMAVEIQRELEASGQKVTRAQVLDAMLFNAAGTRLRIEAVQKVASVRADDPTAQAFAFVAGWVLGQVGDDPRCLEDFIGARQKAVTQDAKR